MKKNAVMMIVIMMFISTMTMAASTQPPQTGSSLPEIKMIKPVEAGDLKYLGISGSGTFLANEVKGQALIIQIFSLYCPYCQKDAPNVNRFFGLIENNPKLKGKIKILGIGAGNSQFEVNTFKKKYKVEFPLIPDADFQVHKMIGEVRTPYFIVVKLKGPKKLEVVYSRLGAHENVEAFLDEVIKLANVQ
ncbi:MAG: thiol-disulfide oxidoreductase [Deltaproteobacteria bacterium ADurb.Bin151]|nr:MAG: thiol-disulfide oxidoreductase [Deltaproteobacteria bacterium ADurb.Bin151]HNZ11284.1 redoxin domain-containing protein [Smithellaceae bacterium]HOG82164.1 redoxin domain-containing protein [Smithellaceae bacterium]HPL65951.1 redoxin domain-containing protein [Smithellaceae bacterium]HQP23725.1 redoxin domain-containing protein [Smithellaceae bacterium]